MRAGLKIDKLAFKRAGRVVLRLAALPMLFEACVDTGLYYWYHNLGSLSLQYARPAALLANCCFVTYTLAALFCYLLDRVVQACSC